VTFKAILQTLQGEGLKFIDVSVTQNFTIFIRKKCYKIRLFPNLKSDLIRCIKIILEGGLFFTYLLSIHE